MITADTFPVSVIISWQPVEGNRWVTERWRALGVIAGVSDAAMKRSLIHSSDSERQYLWNGFTLSLFKDDTESYYSNLRGAKPGVFVICRQDEGTEIVPFLVTVSYDEAASYMEVDDQVYSVPIPPEIYVWLEQYVVQNYVPQQKKKRKRKRWHSAES